MIRKTHTFAPKQCKRQFRGGAGISKVVRPLQIKDHSCMSMTACERGGGGLQQASSATKKQTNLAEKTCTQRSSFQTVVGTGAGGESPQKAYCTRRARLRSRTTASSGMRHIASSCTSYTHVYLATRGC